MKKKTGSSPTSRDNRKTARSTTVPGTNRKFKSTKEAREGGMYLPTKAQKAANKKRQNDVDLESTRPLKNIQEEAERAIEAEKKKKGKR